METVIVVLDAAGVLLIVETIIDDIKVEETDDDVGDGLLDEEVCDELRMLVEGEGELELLLETMLLIKVAAIKVDEDDEEVLLETGLLLEATVLVDFDITALRLDEIEEEVLLSVGLPLEDDAAVLVLEEEVLLGAELLLEDDAAVLELEEEVLLSVGLPLRVDTAAFELEEGAVEVRLVEVIVLDIPLLTLLVEILNGAAVLLMTEMMAVLVDEVADITVLLETGAMAVLEIELDGITVLTMATVEVGLDDIIGDAALLEDNGATIMDVALLDDVELLTVEDELRLRTVSVDATAVVLPMTAGDEVDPIDVDAEAVEAKVELASKAEDDEDAVDASVGLIDVAIVLVDETAEPPPEKNEACNGELSGMLAIEDELEKTVAEELVEMGGEVEGTSEIELVEIWEMVLAMGEGVLELTAELENGLLLEIAVLVDCTLLLDKMLPLAEGLFIMLVADEILVTEATGLVVCTMLLDCMLPVERVLLVLIDDKKLLLEATVLVDCPIFAGVAVELSTVLLDS